MNCNMMNPWASPTALNIPKEFLCNLSASSLPMPFLYFPNNSMHLPLQNPPVEQDGPRMSSRIPFDMHQHPQHSVSTQGSGTTVKPEPELEPPQLLGNMDAVDDAAIDDLMNSAALLKTPLSKRMKNRSYYEMHKKEINMKRAEKKKAERVEVPPVEPTRGQIGKQRRNRAWYIQNKDKILAQQAGYRKRLKIDKIRQKIKSSRGKPESEQQPPVPAAEGGPAHVDQSTREAPEFYHPTSVAPGFASAMMPGNITIPAQQLLKPTAVRPLHAPTPVHPVLPNGLLLGDRWALPLPSQMTGSSVMAHMTQWTG